MISGINGHFYSHMTDKRKLFKYQSKYLTRKKTKLWPRGGVHLNSHKFLTSTTLFNKIRDLHLSNLLGYDWSKKKFFFKYNLFVTIV